MKKSNRFIGIIAVIIVIAIAMIGNSNKDEFNTIIPKADKQFSIISSTENRDLEPMLQEYARKNNIDLTIEYAGTIDIMDKINQGEKYDAVFCSNSIWLYMLKDKSAIKNSKSISINPITFGIKKSKAVELGFDKNPVYTQDIVNAIRTGKLKFVMPSVTRTNSGASAYLAFLTTLAGSPEVLTEENLKSPELRQSLVEVFSGVQRNSGSEEFLEELLESSEYNSIVTYETSIININKRLVDRNQEPYYLIYAKDGVALSDSPFAYIDRAQEKEEVFKSIQSYLLSRELQDRLMQTGRRVWYGGTNDNTDKNIFNPEWGIYTNSYLVPIKYPSAEVIKDALGIYQSELRKPTHTIFCLDYSGSMAGKGITQLSDAMQYILNKDKSEADLLQFSEKDKITVIPFSNTNLATWSTNNGINTNEIINNIIKNKPGGGTNIYGAAIKALELLNNEDANKYNLSVVLMTDGENNVGQFKDMEKYYKDLKKEIPVYSIMFGDASANQLNGIANLTKGKVFDGRNNLLEAFKEVRGYN